MNDCDYKKTLKFLRRGSFLQPPEGARDRLLARLKDRKAAIASNSADSVRKIRELRFLSQFKYALTAALLIIGLFNACYLKTGGDKALERWENSIQAYRSIGELIMDTPIGRELSHAAMMSNRERGETDEI